MKKYIKIWSLIAFSLLLTNCSDDEPAAPLADFQFLIEGTQVTFNGTVANADNISWDFGDGTTSNEEDPVYAYSETGTYTVVMTVKGNNGSFSETKQVRILPSTEILLTGGQAKTEGKSWRLKKAYTPGKEGAGAIDNGLPLSLPSMDNVLGAIGLGNSYEDTFTFYYDGRYEVDNKDGQSLMGLVTASMQYGPDITVVSGDPDLVPLAHVLYTPLTDATWEIEKGDFTVASAMGPVEFKDKTQLILTEYLGFKDAKVLVILKSIDETTMNVALGLHTVPEAIDKPTMLFHLTFESL